VSARLAVTLLVGQEVYRKLSCSSIEDVAGGVNHRGRDAVVARLAPVFAQAHAEDALHEGAQAPATRLAVAVAGHELAIPAAAGSATFEHALDDDAGGVEVEGVIGGAVGRHDLDQMPAGHAAIGEIIV